MGDTNAIPTGVWIRAELVEALREELDEGIESARHTQDEVRVLRHRLVSVLNAARAVVEAASGPWAELRADLEVQQKQGKGLAADLAAALARNAECPNCGAKPWT